MSKDLPEGLTSKEDLSLYGYCNGNLNFSTVSHDDEDYNYQKKKIMRDPMSHRIIEKRRRDRMNNCLADLSRLIPPEYLKKGRGRIEKTEIIEMAIKHMRHLQSIIASKSHGHCENLGSSPPGGISNREYGNLTTTTHQPIIMEHYRLGYLECLSEAMHFLVEVQGYFAGDSLCVQMHNHLHKHCDKIFRSDSLNQPRKHTGETTSSSSSGSPTNGNYSNNSPPLGSSVSNGFTSDDNQINPPYQNGRIFEPIEDHLSNFRSPRGYGDLVTKDSKRNCESYCSRCPEPENERISENPSDSDMELGSSSTGKAKEACPISYEDAHKCNGIECPPRNSSSSSGIGSNADYSYDEFVVKEENGSSQLREMLTTPRTTNISIPCGAVPIRTLDIKRSGTPPSQDFECDVLVNRQNSLFRGVNSLNPQSQADNSICKTQNITVDINENISHDVNNQNPGNVENVPTDTQCNMYKFKNNIKQRFSKEKRDLESDDIINHNKKIKVKETVPENINLSHFGNNGSGKRYQNELLMKERLSLLYKDDDDFENMKMNRYLTESDAPLETDIDDISNRLSFGQKAGYKWKNLDENTKFSKWKFGSSFSNPGSPMDCKPCENGRKSIGLLTITEYLSPDQSILQKFVAAENEVNTGIPVFALHSKGSFYIPLTLDKSVLTPFLPLLGFTSSERIEEKPALHPVTISVNFQTSYHSRNLKQGETS